MFKKIVLIAFAVVMATACSAKDVAPRPESDSGQNYRNGRIPVDDNVYVITGRVVADVNSLIRQTAPAQGSYSTYNGTGGGSFFGPQFDGKGFVRLLVSSVLPEIGLTVPGEVAIIKTTDTKAAALLPGDVVTFHCRAQYEAMAAVRENQTFNVDEGTWEWDYCRLPRPSIRVPSTNGDGR